MSDQRRILFVGNPGAGKSTLLNCHAGQVAFKSGMSYGRSLTSQLDEHVVNGIKYFDTPGLADDLLRKEAAAAITAALKQGGEYQIVFVLLSVHGRVRPDDMTTMKLVLDSCPEMGNNYGVIVNQCKERFMKDIVANPVDPKTGVGVRDQFEAILFSGVKERKTPFKLYLPEADELSTKDDTRMDIQELMDFMELVPSIHLTPNKAVDVNSDSWVDLQNQNEKYKKLLEDKIEELRKAMLEQEELDKKHEQQIFEHLELKSRLGQMKKAAAEEVGQMKKAAAEEAPVPAKSEHNIPETAEEQAMEESGILLIDTLPKGMYMSKPKIWHVETEAFIQAGLTPLQVMLEEKKEEFKISWKKGTCDFVVLLRDRDFKPTMMGMYGPRAESAKQKRVVPLHEWDDRMILEMMDFRGGRDIGRVYRQHPFKHEVFIPLSAVHATLKEEKARELIRIMTDLGAKELSLKQEETVHTDVKVQAKVTAANMLDQGGKMKLQQGHATSLVLDFKQPKFPTKPGIITPAQSPEFDYFLNEEPSWGAMVDSRSECYTEKCEVRYHYTNDYGVSCDLVVGLQGLGFNVGGKFQKNFMEESKFIVKFYSKDDYKNWQGSTSSN